MRMVNDRPLIMARTTHNIVAHDHSIVSIGDDFVTNFVGIGYPQTKYSINDYQVDAASATARMFAIGNIYKAGLALAHGDTPHDNVTVRLHCNISLA